MMLTDEQLLELFTRVMKCPALIGNKGEVIKNKKANTYAIVFDGYQTLKIKIEVEPVFDMTDDELEDILTLIAVGVPLIPQLISDNSKLKEYIRMVLDSMYNLMDIHRTFNGDRRIKIITEKEYPTVGEK